MGTENNEEEKVTPEPPKEEEKASTPAPTPSAPSVGLDFAGLFERLDALPEKILNAWREGSQPAEPPKVETPKQEPVKAEADPKPAEGDKKQHIWFREWKR